MADDDNEKQEITNYLKLYALEESLDEIINAVVVEKPNNPYVRIGQLFEIKTMPEIINIELRPTIVKGLMGVEAIMITNITSFNGITTYKKEISEEYLINPPDYSIIQEKILDAVIDITPDDLSKFDECISNLSGIDPAVSLALSIACCKAAARHKALPIHKYIAGLTGQRIDELAIPVPVFSVLSRVIDGEPIMQDITLTPIKGGNYASILQKLVHVSFLISKHEELPENKITSYWGSPCMDAPNIQAVAKFVHAILEENGLSKDFKIGVHLRSTNILKQPFDPENPIYDYMLEGQTGNAMKGNDLVESMITLWQEIEYITADDMIFQHDHTSLQLFHKRIKETVYDMKESATDVLKYNTYGIGGDVNCNMQVLMNGNILHNIKDFDHFSQIMPYNTIKIQLSLFNNITEIIEVIKQVRTINWSIIVCSNDSNNNIETFDTFLADFSVGIGASQLFSGGTLNGEGYIKYNRLMELQREDTNITYIGEKFRLNVRT